MDDLSNIAASPAVQTSLVAIVEANPVVVFTDKERQEKFFADIKAEVEAHVPDVETAKGRDAIRSLAFKVTKCKTGIDKAGLKLTEEARAQIAQVNAARKDIAERLEDLADKAREPLTKWEQAEADRKNAVEVFINRVRARQIVCVLDTSSDVAETLAELKVMADEITGVTFQDRETEARDLVASTIDQLEAIHARLVREEADRAELARLRAAEEERQRIEAEKAAAEAERLRIEAEEKARVEAAERAEREEAERLARIEQEAADKARREAQEAAERAQQEAAEKAREEQAAKDREYEAKLAEANRIALEERRQREEAEARAKAEADRIERERQEQERQDAAQKAADDKRQSDQRHRASIMTAAKVALMAQADIAEEVAKRIVLAIAADSIPAISIKF